VTEFWDDLTNPEYVYGHLTYILSTIAVAMRSMRWLRTFLIASGCVGIFYYGFVIGDRVSTIWEFVFTAVNIVQLAIILFVARLSAVDEHERFFIQQVTPSLDESQRRKLMKIALAHRDAGRGLDGGWARKAQPDFPDPRSRKH